MRDPHLPEPVAAPPVARADTDTAPAARPPLAGRAQRWLAASVTNRIAVAAASITAAVMLGLGIAAYGFAQDALTRFARAELRAQAQLVARRLTLVLTEVDRDLGALATSATAARALSDPAGRANLLQPLLNAHALPADLRFQVTLADAEARPLVSSGPLAALDPRAAALLAALPAAGGSRALLDAERVLIVAPVRDGASAARGALVLEASLPQLFADAAAQAPGTEQWLVTGAEPLVQLDPQASLVLPSRAPPGDGGPALVAREPVVLGGGLADARLAVVLKRPATAPVELPDGQIAAMLALGAVLLALVMVVARLAARRLTAPLAALAAAAGRITRGAPLQVQLPSLGSDEVGVLATALDGMLARLRDAQQGLEAQVAERTAALALAQQRNAVILAQMHDGLVLLDADGEIQSLNHAAEVLFGVAEEQVTGLHMSRLVAGWFKAARAPMQAGQQRFVLTDLIARRGDSDSFSADCAVALIASADRRQWSVLVRDVTERRRAAEALRLANERLRNSLAELQRRDGQMARINRMNDLLQACQSLDEAYGVIGETLAALFEHGGGVLARTAADGTRLEVVARWGQPVCAPTFAAADCWALRLNRMHCADPGDAAPRCTHVAAGSALRHVCVPLTVEGRVAGAISAGFAAAEARAATPVLIMAAESVRAALANLRLRAALSEQALSDELTGLHNRRFLDEALRHELERARRDGQPLAVVMIDLDHFKRFNDDYGHAAGDHVLREIARHLRARLRASDVVCRYGGEELTVLLPATGLADACERLDRLRAEVAALPLALDGVALPAVTVSMGVALADPERMTPRDAIRAADQALYAAKAAGRNRVQCGVLAADADAADAPPG